MGTWNTLSLHRKVQPRASRCFTRSSGSEVLNEAWSFTLVSPPHAKSAATSPLGVKPLTWRTVMLCKQLILARETSPTSVTDVYEKLICIENSLRWSFLCDDMWWKGGKNVEHTCLRFWEKQAREIIPASSMLRHFFMSSLESCLHPIAMASRPTGVIRRHPRVSSVFSFEHFDKDIKERSVMDLQYAMLIISRSRQPLAMAEMLESPIPSDLANKR